MAIFIWWSVVYILTSNYHANGADAPSISTRGTQTYTQQFTIKSADELRSYIRTEYLNKAIPAALGQTGFAIGKMWQLDYNKPPRQLVADIGEIVVPLISVGLALLPGLGPLIGGVVSFAFGALSPLIRGTTVSPMKMLIDDINNQLQNIHRRFKELEDKLTDEMRKEREAQLSSILSRAFHSEMSRNDYICNKYARVSSIYIEELKNNCTIDESLRIEMMAQMENCDNFLKDTTEAFVYPEFADVLWFPSAVMTFLRVAFLAEVSNYGVSLKINEGRILMFWVELKADIKRHLKFMVDVVKKRIQTIGDRDSLTVYEHQSCKIQRQLLYLDREIYPFGIPNQTVISGDESEVKIADFNVTAEGDDIRHIQIFYNEYRKQHSYYSKGVLNCIMGPTAISRMPNADMTFRITYVPKRSYQVRVLYFITEGNVNSEGELSEFKFFNKISISAHKEDKGDPFQVMRMTEEDPRRSPQRFEFETALYEMICDMAAFSHFPYRIKYTNAFSRGYYKLDGSRLSYNKDNCFVSGAITGRFVVETVFAFNILSANASKSTIILEDIRRYGGNTIFFGVELIIRSPQDFLSTW